MQGRRNRGGQAPQVFASALFPGAKCPFFAWKIFIKIAFFAQRALLKTSIYDISGKMFQFRGKISYIRKIFLYFRENVLVFRKKCGMSGKIFCRIKMRTKESKRTHKDWGKLFTSSSIHRQKFRSKFNWRTRLKRLESKKAEKKLDQNLDI
jgi:hypothetical protein